MTSIKGGYTNYGQDIGILMMHTVFPRLIGDIGNARTFSIPVRYCIVDVDPLNMTEKNADERLLQPFIRAAQQLEAEGCKAITTSCGFLGSFQQQLADYRVNKVTDICNEGDYVSVKVLDIDPANGKISLSRKAALKEMSE